MELGRSEDTSQHERRLPESYARNRGVDYDCYIGEWGFTCLRQYYTLEFGCICGMSLVYLESLGVISLTRLSFNATVLVYHPLHLRMYRV